MGNLSEFRHDPLAFLTRCARGYGDLVRLRFGPLEACLVSHPDLVEKVLVGASGNFPKGRSRRASRLLFSGGMLESEGEIWRRQRRATQPAFHSGHVHAHVEAIMQCTRRATESWQAGEVRDLSEEMARLALAIVFRCLFDCEPRPMPQRVREALQELDRQFTEMRLESLLLPEWAPTPAAIRLRSAIRSIHGWIREIISQRRSRAPLGDDLLSLLIASHEQAPNEIDEVELVHQVATFLLAGHETTALTLAWTLWLVALHPTVADKLAEEARTVLADTSSPDTVSATALSRLIYTGSVLKESLRLFPPVYAMGRAADQDCCIGGYQIFAGTLVFVSQWVIHRDSRWFAAPEEFRPERWNAPEASALPKYAFLPFGAGARRCIGHSFAMTSATLVLALLSRSFRFAVVPGPVPRPSPSMTLRPEGGIPLRLGAC